MEGLLPASMDSLPPAPVASLPPAPVDSLPPAPMEDLLMHFVQNNWTGPYRPLEAALEAEQAAGLERIMSELVVDGEYPYRLVRDPILLHRALRAGGDPWLATRCLFVHQRILENASATLKEAIVARVRLLEDGSPFLTEAALMAQYYHEEALAAGLLERAAAAIGFAYGLTGVLGRRTRFQTFDTTQLVVRSSEAAQAPPVATPAATGGPQDIGLEDDLLLERPALAEDHSGALSVEALSILLAQAQHLLTFHARDAVINERATAFVLRVLEAPSRWAVYSAALYLRSKLEAGKARLVERATLQVQALVDQIGLAEPPAAERLTGFFATGLASPWEMDAYQGYLFASLGAYKTALAVFSRRELWDEAIACLVQLGDQAGAEQRLASEMARCPDSPKLWCLLGDLKGDAAHYETAWRLSGGRYSRAQRSLGKLRFKEQRWADAAGAFCLSLELNPLFPNTWFLLGCAALQLGDDAAALQAFGRVVAQESENAEAWNNLATIHMRADRPQEAMQALKEASRLDYENWRIWANYFGVALGAGELLVAVHALYRVAQIRQADFDVADLQRLVALLDKAVQFVGPAEAEMQAVRRRCASLIDDVLAASLPARPEVWRCAARLAALFGDGAAQKRELFRAYRAAKALPFGHDAAAFGTLVAVIVDLADCLRREGDADELFQLELLLGDVRAAAARSYDEGSPAFRDLLAVQL